MRAALLGLLFAVGASAGHSQTKTSAASRSEDDLERGSSRWPIKVSVPDGADLDHPIEVPLANLLSLDPPESVKHRDGGEGGVLEDRRIEAPVHVASGAILHEGDIIATSGYVTVVAGETDGDFHIQIAERPWDDDAYEQTPCLIVEAPGDEERFGATNDLRKRFAAVRAFVQSNFLDGAYPGAHGVAIKRPARIRVAGQLFADVWHLKKDGSIELRGKRGQTSTTIWEIHPVTAIELEKPDAP